MMNIDTIITRLGGIEQAARITGVSTEAIRKWRQAKAIPSRHWSVIIQETGLSLSDLQPDNPVESSLTPPNGADAVLLLEDGTILWGLGFGAYTNKEKPAIGEICFSTGMTGYQETLTDPSFAGQLITFTFPHIGNVGTNPDDNEAAQIAARGLIVKQNITEPANWRSTASLCEWLKENHITGICAIDTRTLTLRIRDQGPQNALLFWPEDGLFDIPALQEQVKAWPGLQGMDLAKEVTCTEAFSWNEGAWHWPEGAHSDIPSSHHVVAIDYGAKRNIFRNLVEAGCRLTVVPATASAEEILSYNPDGVFLSNGPADPAATAQYAVPVLQKLLEKRIPIFGICLGHQLLSLALGGKTYKLEQGHRGANQPVKNMMNHKVEITSQNHGFAVDPKSLPADAHATHINLFDGSNEGVASDKYPAFSVQYHPEASPGPTDSRYLFQRFIELMNSHPVSKNN